VAPSGGAVSPPTGQIDNDIGLCQLIWKHVPEHGAQVAAENAVVRGQDARHHGGLFDRSDDLQGAATRWAMLDSKREHALEHARPAHARRCAMRMITLVGVLGARVRSSRHDRGTQFGVGREHPARAAPNAALAVEGPVS
jgi:hypothetical protein